jgi:membrane protease YdiL (CAAX protease family)
LLPAMLLSALAFGLAHNPTNAGTFMIAVAGLLFGSQAYLSDFYANFWRATVWLAPFVAGGVLFAWLTHRWKTLWPAIGLHACLNLWWELAPGSYAFASLRRLTLEPLPIAHAIAVLIAIGVTLGRTRSSSDR